MILGCYAWFGVLGVLVCVGVFCVVSLRVECLSCMLTWVLDLVGFLVFLCVDMWVDLFHCFGFNWRVCFSFDLFASGLICVCAV